MGGLKQTSMGMMEASKNDPASLYLSQRKDKYKEATFLQLYPTLVSCSKSCNSKMFPLLSNTFDVGKRQALTISLYLVLCIHFNNVLVWSISFFSYRFNITWKKRNSISYLFTGNLHRTKYIREKISMLKPMSCTIFKDFSKLISWAERKGYT